MKKYNYFLTLGDIKIIEQLYKGYDSNLKNFKIYKFMSKIRKIKKEYWDPKIKSE